MRVMDNGTGFGLNYALLPKSNQSPLILNWRRKSQLHVSGSQLVKHFMGLLCNKLLGVEINILDLMRDMEPSPNKPVAN
jgi:hypothetical protein